ncbi:MAG: copper homeostasis protein [Arcticibacterium sp.]|jgi:copper homeostasis protein
MQTETEICCFSLASAMVAHRLCTDRVELCGGYLEGGTTPSQGLIKLVLENIVPKTFVMIRPRGGDFCYSESEVLTIYSEIFQIKSLNPGGFVFGALNANGTVDGELCKKVLTWASPFPVTFHRAFDQCPEPMVALDTLIDLGFERILTSGQKESALKGLDVLTELVKRAEGRIQIMAGAGVNADNVTAFIEAGIPAVHFTAKEWQKSCMAVAGKVSMQAGELPDDTGSYETSEEAAEKLMSRLIQKPE